MYFLGQGTAYADIVVGVIFMGVLFAQGYRCETKVKALEERVKASEAEKIQLVEKQIEITSKLNGYRKVFRDFMFERHPWALRS